MLSFIVVFFLGLFTVYLTTSWVDKRRDARCQKYKYEYKPHVRTFIEEQTQPASVFKMYKNMFWQESPWVSTHANPQAQSTGRINPFILGALPTTDIGTVKESNNYLNAVY